MLTPFSTLRVSVIAIVSVGTLVLASSSAGAFGSLNIVGQNAEHEHVTREIGKADPAWQPNSLSMLAGKDGNLGGVGAPDRPWDTSSNVLKGSGPAYKHCDDGDYLAKAGYPQSKSAAQTAFEDCIDYYQSLVERAVVYSGKLVKSDLSVNPSVFQDTDRIPSTFKPDNVCKYKFSMAADDGGPKCDVMNALGRALHMAEDIYAHTNWADLADPTRPISVSNPPGLGRTDIPSFLRFPADTVVPDGLISGCDDTASGTQNCDNRVSHSGLAKDNGEINDDGSTSPTTKYPRGDVIVDGVTNFQRAVEGGKKQAVSTWEDFKAAVVQKYGTARGEKIISVIQSDVAPSGAALENESADAASTSPGLRQAGGVDAPSSNAAAPTTQSNSAVIWWVVLGVLIAVMLIFVVAVRKTRSKRNA